MTKKMDEIFNIETIVPDTKVTKDIEVIEESIDICLLYTSDAADE